MRPSSVPLSLPFESAASAAPTARPSSSALRTPHSLRARYAPLDYAKGLRELSALSDRAGHGHLPKPPPASSSPRRLPPQSLSHAAPLSPRPKTGAVSLGSSPRTGASKLDVPSNRSEAAVLAWRLRHQLAEVEGDYRAELATYGGAFAEVTRQVAVHCSGSGTLVHWIV